MNKMNSMIQLYKKNIISCYNNLYKDIYIYKEMKYYEHIFSIIVNIIILTYVLVALGVWSYYPTYLQTLEFYHDVFICSILLLVYNPIYQVSISPQFLRTIGFSAGIAILLNLISRIVQHV